MYMYLNRFTFRKTSFVNQEVLYKARLLSSFTQSSVPNFVVALIIISHTEELCIRLN